MQAQTREIVADSMIREWQLVWAGVPGLRPDAYAITDTATKAVADFQRRFPFVPVHQAKLVLDEDVWTIRVTLADKSVVTLFAA